MGSSSLVSIVIPCFNAESFIAEAIESALGQSYPNVEVVVVDDGSTDSSLAVVKSFGDRVRWYTGPNLGGCAARNRGVQMARGELIQFLDSDDLLCPDKLKVQVPLALQSPDDVTYCDYEARDFESGKQCRIHSAESRGLDPVEFVLLSQRLQTSAPLHERDRLLEMGGFREGLSCAQEYDLHLRLACSGARFLHVPEVLHVVRQRRGSVSSNSMRVIDQHKQILLEAWESLAQAGKLTDRISASFAGILATDARVYIRNQQYDRACHYFQLAAKLHENGGLDRAYSAPVRWLRSIVGAVNVERFVSSKRRLMGNVVS
ncbi:glycosyltransferase family 2 protein [Blastopirellula marina]|uniref:Family 2 glycosyl transferase n=1 Tax=Blastopirellula marina TaxID=124 RepID=A0A2S8G1R5_9BACT|nr:glycosyltransferase [Blastopirellula marina]PQO38074.1 family 2 glycosyl transferase [Blastopirellula marina]PTL44730.1 family 2 glycosyl transferase [Blastopirellula marina]